MQVHRLLAALALGLFAALFAMPGPAPAQDDLPQFGAQAGSSLPGGALAAPDYEEWNRLARRAEAALEAGRASDAAFEDLRAQIAAWRARFLDAQNQNQSRIRTIESQINALGPAPAEGETEAEEVAARRTELNQQLAQLRAPVVAAEEAYNRADGIVGEIDALIRARQTDELFKFGPMPILPDNWVLAWDEISDAWRGASSEVVASWNSDVRRTEIRSNLPLVLLLLAVGLVLLFRGRTWARSAGFWMRHNTSRGGAVLSFLVSVGQIALPLIGLLALTEAMFATGVPGVRLTLVLEKLPAWGALILGLRWLADRLFSQHDGDRMLPMPRPQRREARVYASTLAIFLVLRDAIAEFGVVEGFSDPTLAVLYFPLIVASSLIIFRLGQLMIRHIRFDNANAERAVRARVVTFFGRIVMLVSVVAPVLAATGYGNAASRLIFPSISTLGLLGLIVVLQRFTNDLYRFLMRQSDEEADSLIAVLIGFMLAIGALPFLALIWGARVADLTELWTRIGEGFAIGESRISPMDFFLLIVVFIVGYMGTRLLQGALRNSILPKTKIDAGGQNAIISGIGYVGIFVAALVAITSAGLDLSSLAIVAGALSVGIGFGLQNIVSNFVSGIILLIERPIAEGDWIEVGGTHGTVKRISVRSTRLETFDRYDVIIPNADFVSGRVSNYTRGNSVGRIVIPVGVAYGSDTRKVERLLLNIARHHDQVLLNPEPAVDFIGFGADSLDFQIRAVLYDIGNGMSVRTEMRHQIVEAFAKEKIEVPFAQRDIWLRNPEALAPAPPKGETAERAEDKPDAPAAPPPPPQAREPSPGEGLEGNSDGVDAEGSR
ncbi:MAG: mechanosensitive ion channel family protein [Rhodobacteraceae bacterium]|nr:MAG: mechanosensitive ion channel family protein [Paracoccaceae bacterium]